MSDFDTLAELQYRRKFYINRINMTGNAVRALTRRALGWNLDLPEAERKKINARAERIVAAVAAGREVPEDDAEVAAAIAPDLAVARLASKPMEDARHSIELDMKRIVRRLPIYEWAKTVKGLGEIGLAVIVAEAGDLARYQNPAKLWKRLGLAPHNGRAASTWRFKGGLSADDWTGLGYSPRRRAQIYGCVEEPMMKACAGTKYRAVYDHAKETFTPRAESKAHAHRHAMRVMAKEITLDLWRVWHGFTPRRRECEGQTDGDAQSWTALADSPLIEATEERAA